jgi:hypothetical protein
MGRLSDKEINEMLQQARDEVSVHEFKSLQSIGRSNLVIAELLQRILEQRKTG